jgi:hypothetical protein
LQTHYGKLFENGAGPSDYLEKIFQVPFWLPRLGPGDPAFAGLARVLMPEGATAEKEGREAVTEAVAKPTGAAAIDPDEGPQPGDETPQESRAATAQRVTLTMDEAEVLAVLMPLAASTPRGAKRFVNLYRLARASRHRGDLETFLGPMDGHRDFIPFAFALALGNRTGTNLIDRMEKIIENYQGDRDTFAEIMRKIYINNKDLVDSWITFDDYNQMKGLTSTMIRRGAIRHDYILSKMTPKSVQRHLPEARRYSFHPPQVDEPAPSPEAPPEPTGSSPA